MNPENFLDLKVMLLNTRGMARDNITDATRSHRRSNLHRPYLSDGYFYRCRYLPQEGVFYVSDAYLWAVELAVLADTGRKSQLEGIWERVHFAEQCIAQIHSIQLHLTAAPYTSIISKPVRITDSYGRFFKICIDSVSTSPTKSASECNCSGNCENSAG